MKGLLLEYKYRIMESGIKYVIWILLVLQLIIGFFGFGTGGAVLSALLVIQLNDTMIDDQACGWNQYCKILPVSGRKQVGMRYLLGIVATAIMTIIFLIGRALGVLNVEVPFYEVKQVDSLDHCSKFPMYVDSDSSKSHATFKKYKKQTRRVAIGFGLLCEEAD